MTPTHAISADEARRLLQRDRDAAAYGRRLARAKEWAASQPGYLEKFRFKCITPFGTFTGEEMRGESYGEAQNYP